MVVARITNMATAPLLGVESLLITDSSTLLIDGEEYPIPLRHESGGTFAPKRIMRALKDAGYRPVPDYYTALGVDGPDSIQVERT